MNISNNSSKNRGTVIIILKIVRIVMTVINDNKSHIILSYITVR